MSTKPIIVNYYADRTRSPTWTRFCQLMAQNELVEVVNVWDGPGPHDKNNPSHIENVIMQQLQGRIPDLIVDGFGSVGGVIMSQPLIKEYKIKVMRVIADLDNHMKEHPVYHSIVSPDYFMIQSGPGTAGYERCELIRDMVPNFKGTEIYTLPWGGNSEFFEKINLDKDRKYDFGLVQTVDPGDSTHYYRLIVQDLINNELKYKYEVVRGMIDNRYDYFRTLADTKILFCDTVTRGIAVAKYYEAMCSKSLIIGELPDDNTGLFEDGVSMVALETKSSNREEFEAELKDKVAYYLEHEDERVKIATEGYNRLMAKHKVIDRVNEFCQWIHDHVPARGMKVMQCSIPNCGLVASNTYGTPIVGGLCDVHKGEADYQFFDWFMQMKRRER